MQDRSYRTVQVLSVISKLVRVAIIVAAALVAIASWFDDRILHALFAIGVMVIGVVSLWRTIVRTSRVKDVYRRWWRR